jgi:uncharacterized membrane protein YfcA
LGRSNIEPAVLLILLGGVRHWILESTDGGLMVSLLIGSIPGIIVGSLLASRDPTGCSARSFAVVPALIGVRRLL